MKKCVSCFKLLSVIFFFCFLFFTCVGAKKATSKKCRPLNLASVHIVDRNGFSETVGNKERLAQFQSTNFLAPQPYQKVLRIYTRDSRGSIRSVVNTYHENGNPKQFLEILNGRANGCYCEWHENGNMSLSTRVINGTPDVTPIAERSWLFDGSSCAWDTEGNLIASISYDQGSLEGLSTYYHKNGEIWKLIPYYKNQIEGTVEIYKADRTLLQQTRYVQGKKQGTSVRYWCPEQLASCEEYCKGKLDSGQYFDQNGLLISEIKDGNGFRVIFGKKHIQEMQEFVDGCLEGEVKVFNQEGRLKRIYHIKNGIKHGEEVEYYDRFFPSEEELSPKLSFYWYEGKIQGHAKTWYPSGVLESQKEMANNEKHGLLTTWYKDGNLMMMEQYEHNKLVRGDYFKKDEKIPVSQIIDGKGIVSIFDADGHFVQKISYCNGKPEIQ